MVKKFQNSRKNEKSEYFLIKLTMEKVGNFWKWRGGGRLVLGIPKRGKIGVGPFEPLPKSLI